MYGRMTPNKHLYFTYRGGETMEMVIEQRYQAAATIMVERFRQPDGILIRMDRESWTWDDWGHVGILLPGDSTIYAFDEPLEWQSLPVWGSAILASSELLGAHLGDPAARARVIERVCDAIDADMRGPMSCRVSLRNGDRLAATLSECLSDNATADRAWLSNFWLDLTFEIPSMGYSSGNGNCDSCPACHFYESDDLDEAWRLLSSEP